MYFNIYDLVLWSFAGAKEKKFFSSNKTLEKIPFSVVHFRVTSTVCNVVNTIVMQTQCFHSQTSVQRFNENKAGYKNNI